jgi:ADP-heptose:LPS heptosyltransferase
MGNEDEYILIHPGASWRFKQWSAEKMARLVIALNGAGHSVRLVAGPEDRAFADRVSKLIDNALPFEFPTLEELYRLIARARAVICNNSAALHIAEALETRCLALTGPSDPVVWGTYREHSRTLVRSVGLPCHPCRERRCVRANRPCIDEIEVMDVLQSLADMGVLHDRRSGAVRGSGVQRVMQP